MKEQYGHIDFENEKVIKIINYAFEEFSKYSFEKASTNSIVKRAGISRGLLYHYFKDKQDLYDFLLYYSVKITLDELDAKQYWKEQDIFKRIKQVAISKMEIAKKYPYLIDFYKQIKDVDRYKKVKGEAKGHYPDLDRKFYSYNVDFSNVKDGVDIEKMVNVIKYTLEQVGRKYWEAVKENGANFQLDDLFREYDEYIEFLKTAFYHEDS